MLVCYMNTLGLNGLAVVPMFAFKIVMAHVLWKIIYIVVINEIAIFLW